jgi:ABC-type sugar transport system ATPase subunit
MTHSTGFNLALPWVRRWIRGCIPNGAERAAIIRRAITDFAIKVAEPELSIDRLSGGNQQKALVGRWLERRPDVLILDEPTRGVDVGAREEMFRILGQLAESGMAVILISSDLAEVLNMSHRIALYRDGRVLEIADAEQLTMERIMHRLTGAEVHAAV